MIVPFEIAQDLIEMQDLLAGVEFSYSRIWQVRKRASDGMFFLSKGGVFDYMIHDWGAPGAEGEENLAWLEEHALDS